MANPMEMAPPQFWDAIRNFDSLAEQAGIPLRKMVPQFQVIQDVDTTKIKRVARSAWGTSESARGVRNAVEECATSIVDAKSYIESGWDGAAFLAFNSAAEKLRTTLDDAVEPLGNLADSLKEMAEKFEESVGNTMTTVGSLGGFLSAAGGVTTALLSAPEPLVTKVIGIIVGVVGALAAAVSYMGAQITAIEDRKKAAQAAIDQCKTVISRINS